MLPSVVLATLQTDLLVWLDDRHTEHEVFERIIGYMERTVASAGRAEARPSDPPAIAFVDLAGYTELTAIDGDERAADFATNLHVVASRVLSNHDGRVVKQLGDGVLCRFGSAMGAVAGVRELMVEIAQAGLPAAHAAIAVGPFVVREGDVYGNTVNLASRIAAHALPGELLIPSMTHERSWSRPSGPTPARRPSRASPTDRPRQTQRAVELTPLSALVDACRGDMDRIAWDQRKIASRIDGRVRPRRRHLVPIPAILCLADIARPCQADGITSPGRQPGDRPIGRDVLGRDRACVQREPDACEGEEDVANVAVEVGHEVGDDVDQGTLEVAARNGVDQSVDGRPEHGDAVRPRRREQHREVRVG